MAAAIIHYDTARVPLPPLGVDPPACGSAITHASGSLIRAEGEMAAVVRWSTPHARARSLALIPLALGGGEPGNELQTPMAIVILGGLLSATALNMVVLPSLYWLFGERLAATAEARLDPDAA